MSENKLYAGFHCMKVEPPMGIHVPGYYEKRYSDGFLTDLHIRAAAFQCGEDRAIVFSVEAIGINAAAFNYLKPKIAQRCNLPESAIYINCIHSHTAYRITMFGTKEIDDNDIFLMRLFQQFTDCAQFAFEDLKPCSLKIATGEAKGVGFIRRYRMKDGTVRTNPAYGDPDVVAPIGQPDDHVRLIRIQREGAKEILIVHFGNHADMIGGNLYTPDWPGYLVRDLDAVLEGKVNTMFLLGPEGDLNHRNFYNPLLTLKGVDNAKGAARMLTGAVLRVYDLAKPVACDTLRFAHKYVQVGKNTYDPAQLPMAEEIAKIYRTKGSAAPELKDYPMRYQEALRIVANMARPEFFNLRISGLRLGDVAFIGIPGEPFASVGLDIVAKSNMPMTVVTAITNGYEGYYPDAAAYNEPGYSYEKCSSPFAPDCAAKLIEGAMDVLKQLED